MQRYLKKSYCYDELPIRSCYETNIKMHLKKGEKLVRINQKLFSMILLVISIHPLANSATGQKPFALEMPIRCTIGSNCWIVNYVDVDNSSDISDYNCGSSTYNSHKGTDFAIKDADVMRKGIEVSASAGGLIKGTRDNMRDINFNLGGENSIEGKECGNGVLIDHGDGWTTQYCHLLQDSVAVKVGDRVKTGDLLGLVGLSGKTEFPHLHFQVKYNKQIIDPFIGLQKNNKCGLGKIPLWKSSDITSMSYAPTALYNVGFSSTTPNERIAREGLYGEDELFQKSPVIALWVDIFWTKPGDKLAFKINGPGGKLLMTHESIIEKRSSRRFAFAGINRRKGKTWEKGPYTGSIRLTRKENNQAFSITKKITIN